MNIRRVLAVAAIPLVIGTFGFAAPEQANAQTRSNRIAQITQQLANRQSSCPHLCVQVTGQHGQQSNREECIKQIHSPL